MHAQEKSYEEIIADTRQVVENIGCTELTTPEAVDAWIDGQEGLSIVFFNSLCGCAGASARPGLRLALETERPDDVVTVFAGTDREATQRMRERFSEYPPSSPSFLFIKDGSAVDLYERERIVGQRPEFVGETIVETIREHR